MEALLTKKAIEWDYSSFKDYTGVRNGTLCNIKSGIEICGISKIDLLVEVEKEVEEEKIKHIL